MNDNEQDPNDAQGERNDNETILMALDQISQTIDVMTSVVGRLRHFVQEQEMAEEVEVREAMRPGRTLH
jgi:C4-dicarboxylate-specific signal transduction histidine kinase